MSNDSDGFDIRYVHRGSEAATFSSPLPFPTLHNDWMPSTMPDRIDVLKTPEEIRHPHKLVNNSLVMTSEQMAAYDVVHKHDSCNYHGHNRLEYLNHRLTVGEVVTKNRHSDLPTLQSPEAPVAKPDMVNHPPHYKDRVPGIECIEVTRHFGFCTGNAIKYIWRAGLKGDSVAKHREDLEKAIWYLKEELASLEEK